MREPQKKEVLSESLKRKKKHFVLIYSLSLSPNLCLSLSVSLSPCLYFSVSLGSHAREAMEDDSPKVPVLSTFSGNLEIV